MPYVNIDILNTINQDVVNYLHTANNIALVQSATSVNIITIPPIYPETLATIISADVFTEVSAHQFVYEKVAYADLSNTASPDFSSTSAVQPITMVLSAEDNTSFSAFNLSNTECMIYAISTGIINKLIDDHKLVWNSTSAFRWYVDYPDASVTFNYIELLAYSNEITVPSIVSENINAINVMFLDDDNRWKSVDFSLSENSNIILKFDNNYNYVVPTITVTNPSYEASIIDPITIDVTLKTGGSAVHVQEPSKQDISKVFKTKICYFYT